MRIRSHAFWLHGVRVHGVWVAAVGEGAGFGGAGEGEGDAFAMAGCVEDVVETVCVVGAWSSDGVEDLGGFLVVVVGCGCDYGWKPER